MVITCSGFNFVVRLEQKSSFFFVVAGLLDFKLYCFISFAESKIGVDKELMEFRSPLKGCS